LQRLRFTVIRKKKFISTLPPSRRFIAPVSTQALARFYTAVYRPKKRRDGNTGLAWTVLASKTDAFEEGSRQCC